MAVLTATIGASWFQAAVTTVLTTVSSLQHLQHRNLLHRNDCRASRCYEGHNTEASTFRPQRGFVRPPCCP